MLEVSSPGIDRYLTQDWHYDMLMGTDIEINLIRPIDGKKMFVGRLTDKQDGQITAMLEDQTEITFLPKEAAWVRLYVEF